MMMSKATACGKRESGFTLMELLLVMAILVILAGVLLPKLDRLGLKSNKAAAATNAAGTSRYIQTYRIAHNVYPDNWDSLMDATGTDIWTPGAPGTTAGNDPQLTGGPPAGSPHKVVKTTIVESSSDLTIRSLSRMGITTVLDLDGSSTDIPGSRFTKVRSLGTSAVVATLNGADSDAKAIIDHIYPANRLSTGTSGAIPAGNTLVVFGFGPSNTAIGDVLQECPTYANTDPTQYYNRFLAVFEAHADGSRAELKTVTGADGDLIIDEINDYYAK